MILASDKKRSVSVTVPPSLSPLSHNGFSPGTERQGSARTALSGPAKRPVSSESPRHGPSSGLPSPGSWTGPARPHPALLRLASDSDTVSLCGGTPTTARSQRFSCVDDPRITDFNLNRCCVLKSFYPMFSTFLHSFFKPKISCPEALPRSIPADCFLRWA